MFDRLLTAYGPQHWWPADSPFEVAVGAVLTQNTAWGNVEKAISNLRRQGLLSPAALLETPPAELASAIRPSGYFNIKTQRLRALCQLLVQHGGLDSMAVWPLRQQREALLAVHGVGPETADDILLYALQQPVFVIDTYSRRLLQRLGLAVGNEDYEVLRRGFERSLGAGAAQRVVAEGGPQGRHVQPRRRPGHDVALFNEYHALIVRHAKVSCRRTPDCSGCVLRDCCATGSEATG